MLSIVHTRKDLLVEESTEQYDIINEIDTAFPYQFDSRELINVAKIFLHNTNLLLLRSRKVDFIKELVGKDTYPNSLVCYDNSTVKILASGVPTAVDKNTLYLVSEIGYTKHNNSYVLLVYNLGDVSLYGSASSYFRNKYIDEYFS